MPPTTASWEADRFFRYDLVREPHGFMNAGIGDGNRRIGKPDPGGDALRFESCFPPSAGFHERPADQERIGQHQRERYSLIQCIGPHLAGLHARTGLVEPLGNRARAEERA
jgi:hypothetical protein